MGVLEDVQKMLDRIPIWKRLGEVPGEVDDLKRRVAELEAKYEGKFPPDVCKYCGERAVRMSHSMPPDDGKGKTRQEWTCAICQQVEIRLA
jgi:hypothetical protein